MNIEETELSGFGKYPKAKCKVSKPSKINEIIELIQTSTIIPRGLGRSYGDASINNKGVVIESLLFNKFLSFDENSGILKCESGVTYKDILETFVRRGWFPAVTPGTKYVTIGGAISSDVHGKNHHKAGSLSSFVKSIKIIVSSGEIIECSREKNADLFWATIGGMGLTGYIIEAEIQLKKINSPYFDNKTVKLKNIDELFEQFDLHDEEYEFSVAWIDIVATGKKYGRNVLFLGNYSEPDKLPKGLRNNSKLNYKEKKISVPFEIPFNILNKYSINMFNSIYYFNASAKEDYIHYDKYFYPLDFILNWNHIYSKNGLIQYQLIVPEENGKKAIDLILKEAVKYGGGSFLAVLKKMGDQEGILSFPFKGYTLSMDFPVKKGVVEMCKKLDNILLDYGGRTYLTKDSILDEKTFKQMYSGKYEKWIEIKAKYDSKNKFTSNLARRVGLCLY
jgi:FAD/FMN-containing dehydrogenase